MTIGCSWRETAAAGEFFRDGGGPACKLTKPTLHGMPWGFRGGAPAHHPSRSNKEGRPQLSISWSGWWFRSSENKGTACWAYEGKACWAYEGTATRRATEVANLRRWLPFHPTFLVIVRFDRSIKHPLSNATANHPGIRTTSFPLPACGSLDPLRCRE